MPESEFEKLFGDKFDHYSPSPANNRWSEISAALEKRKKKRIFFWYLLTGLIVLLGASVFLFKESAKPTLAYEEKQSKVSESGKNESSDPSGNQTLTNPTENDNVRGTATYDYAVVNPEIKSLKNATLEGKPNITNSGSSKTPTSGATKDSRQPERESTLEAESQNPEKSIKEDHQDQKDTGSNSIEQSDLSDQKPANKGDQPPSRPGPAVKKSPGFMSKMTIGIGISSGFSWHTIRMPYSIGSYPGVNLDMVNHNFLLRKSAEQKGFFLSESLIARYSFHKVFSFGTGITLNQSTQYLQFSAVSADADRVIGPRDFPESGSVYDKAFYRFETDSLIQGKEIRVENKYFYREIPVFIQANFWSEKKVGLTASLGASYRYVSGAALLLPDVDNVGMVSLIGKQYYPGIRSSFHLQGSLGVSVKLGEVYRLETALSYSHALQSNVRFEHWVQQYQRNAGLQVRVLRSFNFTE